VLSSIRRIGVSSAFLVAAVTPRATAQNDTTLVRDVNYVPHSYADTAEGAFYGVGIACAQDRLFQMDLQRRWMRGKLAAVFSEVDYPNFVNIDKAQRLIGWGVHADEVAAQIPDSEVQAILQAYCDGVNDAVAAMGSTLPGLFQHFEITTFDEWTPGDCLLMGDFFSSVTLQLDNWVEEPVFDATETCPGPFADPIFDALGATVHSPPTTDTCTTNTSTTPASLAIQHFGEDGPKASHGFVVRGEKTTTGNALLLGKLQLPVCVPSTLYEFGVHGGDYDVRGVGLVGAPGLLAGWNPKIAWTVTSMKMDQTDVFRLRGVFGPDLPEFPLGGYELDGDPVGFEETREEEIEVLDGPSVWVTYRRTIFGPVVTPLVSKGADNHDQEYALGDQMLRDTDVHTVQAQLGMMKAQSWCEARSAMALWRSPGMNMLVAEDGGNIGYTAVCALPVRSTSVACAGAPGRYPQDGWQLSGQWQGTLPFLDQPWDYNPSEGFIVSGNNLPALPEDFPGNVRWGTKNGDTPRSWRLREILASKLGSSTISPSEAYAISNDCVSPALRVFAKLVDRMLGASLIPDNTPEFDLAIELMTWNDGLAASEHYQIRTSSPIYALLDALYEPVYNFRRDAAAPGANVNSPILAGYMHNSMWYPAYERSEDGGLPAFLRAVEADISDYAEHTPVQNWVNHKLSVAAAALANPLYGADFEHHAKYFELLFDEDAFKQELECIKKNTIWSQAGEAFNFFVDIDALDESKALMPPGVSEDPLNDSAYAHLDAWTEGSMFAAPLGLSEVSIEARSIDTFSY
jgi:penicillin amidase